MVGENIDKHPEVFDQVLQAGHSIGNHTYHHLKGWECSTYKYMTNVAKCNKAIFEHRPDVFIPTLFRPPYGKATLGQRIELHKDGYQIVMWDVLTQDYNKTKSPEWMLKKIQKEVRPGSIINFHDSLKSNERMLEVLPKAIEWLQEQGYELKSL